jgi:UDP-glucose 4-epimerase
MMVRLMSTDMPCNCVITGGAGFIGSQLADNLLQQGHKITAIDNLSWGKKDFLSHNLTNHDYTFIDLDLLDNQRVQNEFPTDVDIVFHLAANSDIMRGTVEPEIDLKNTTIATFNLLNVMRSREIRQIFFTSGSGVYGDVGETFTDEDFSPLLPISMYGATKLSAEAMISAFVNLYDMQAWILRPANIVGPRATHGVIYDFINKIKANPRTLTVFGDGEQSKSYLYVDDVISAINLVWAKAREPINIFNISSDSYVTVREIAEIVIDSMGLHDTEILYTGGSRGWRGDVPIVRLDTSRIEALGWRTRFSSREAVRRTVEVILEAQRAQRD